MTRAALTAAFVYPINTIMNILELDSYNLDDAVKFNDHLNPRLWDSAEHLRPEVREQLLRIAEDFREFLGVPDLDLVDVTISGSNAAYTYTPNSDIDLHLVVNMPEDPVYRELFDAKKFQYNEQHDITIGGADVELYVQNADQPHISQGVYSLINNDWLQVPRRVKSVVDDTSTRNKFETVGRQIERAIKSGNLKRMTRLADKIKKMRQTGLESHGEFGPENLAFKMLRKQGLIKELYDARNAAKDKEFSLKEQPKKPFVYGFKKIDEVGLTPDGTNPTTCMIVDDEQPTDEEILKDFIDFCFKELKLEHMPTIKLRKDPQWPVMHKTFGRYINDHHLLEVAWGGRHIMDVLRTVAHELTHKHQHERDGDRMGATAGETGSPWENEANARAGILMRDYARLHPEYFAVGQAEKLHGDEVTEASVIQNRLPPKLVIGGYTFVLNPTTRTVTVTHGGRPFTTYQYTGPRNYDSYAANAYHVISGTQPTELDAIQKRDQASPTAAQRSFEYPTDSSYRVAMPNQDLDQVYRQHDQATAQHGIVGGMTDLGKFGAMAKRRRRAAQSQDDEVKESASGYIPTRKQARDPRFSMALTQDIRPGQLGKEANKLKLRTDSQGHPQIANPNGLFEKLSLELSQFKKKNQLSERVALDEVRMAPSNLMQWAKSPAAEGIRAGFEAELIFRDTSNNGDDDYEMEPDYDQDERCRSIQQIIDFFQNGDYGGLSPRQERALQEGLDEQYFEWQDEEMYKSWRDERDDLIREAWLREKPMTERIHAALVDGLELTDDQADAVVALHDARAKKEITGPELSDEQLEMASQYSEAASIADDILDEDVEQTIAKEDGFYDEVLDEFRENFYVDDDSGFFDDVGLRWMSDVANSFDLDWPYMTGGGGNDGSRSWDEIGDSLNGVVDMPVKVSNNYHSTLRREGQWIVEPDSSLQPDDREDCGLEIVSPPMPLLTALEKLQEVADWANSDEGNAYTNSSTGLHMGVSVPYKGGDVDYLKLILFLGDEYVLRSFGREANTYTKSAMSKFRENIKGGRSDPMSVIKLMQHGLLELAYKEIQKGVGTGKYTSAHIQNGYIEFRSAGGDWLAEESADPEKLSSTMLRYARAMQIAADPSVERREYAKKLYKLVAPEGDSELALFSQFAAGELTAEQLKKRWAEKTIGTERKMNQRWRLYQNVDGRWEPVPGAEWNGYSEEQVKNAVWSRYGREALDSGEYQLVNMGEQDWEVYDVKTGKTLEIVKGKSKGEVADAVYDKYVDQGIGFQVRPYVDPATLTPRAKLAKRITEPKKTSDWDVIYKPTGRVIDSILRVDQKEAESLLAKVARQHDFENADDLEIRPQTAEKSQSADDRQDSAHLRANLTRSPVGDDPMAAYERNSDRIDAIRQDATNRVGSWSIHDVTLGREVSRMDNVPWSQADARANELEQSTGHNMSVRGLVELEEAIDAVSGAGARAPVTLPKLKPEPKVKPTTPAVKLDIKNKPLDPYAQTYKKPVAEGYGQYTRINDPGIFPDGFLYLSNHAKHDRLPERGIDLDRVIDLCRQAGNQYPQKLRNLGDIQFVIKAPDDFGVGLVKYQMPDGNYRYLVKTAHNRLRYGPEEPVFRVGAVAENFAEGEVVPFRRPQAQPSLPADILHLASEWFHANDDTNTLQAVTDPGYGQGAENLVKYIQAKLQSRGWTIDFDDEIENIVLTNRSGQTVALPVADAYDETGWAKGTMTENFADGKGPGRPGDSQRHGIPKGATMAELEKASHAKGRKGELARWQLNMRRGKKRKHKE